MRGRREARDMRDRVDTRTLHTHSHIHSKDAPCGPSFCSFAIWAAAATVSARWASNSSYNRSKCSCCVAGGGSGKRSTCEGEGRRQGRVREEEERERERAECEEMQK